MLIKKTPIFTNLFLILSIVSFSQTIDRFKAKDIALKFSGDILKFKGGFNDDLIYFGNNNDSSIYIFNFNQSNGFILVSSFNNNNPVLGYCLDTKFEISKIPPALFDLLRNYSVEIEYLKNKQTTDDYVNENEIYNKKQNNIVQPLVTTKWDQACFYNDSCPNAPNAGAYYCQKVPAGCVAVALAQIVRYHKYPTIGSGFNSYYNPYYGTQYANFGNTTYFYSTMPDVLLTKSPFTAQFIYHCAVSVNTQFNFQYSGANINDAKNSLINYFNYLNSIQVVQKNNYTEAAWRDLLKSELDSARPVFLSGYNQNNSGGHAFVCDGYDNNNLFHINWGWGGLYNGYFILNALTPNSNNFSYNQSALIKIKSQNNYPVCHFKTDCNIITKNSQVQFTDLSTGNVNQWKWYFEGGTPNVSYLQNPLVTYNNSGVYKVTLIVSNAYGSDTLTKKDFITVTPFANFSSNKTQISKNENITFNDNSIVSDSSLTYQWVFQGGNPSISNVKNPSVSYNQSGTFKVSLTITTISGSHSLIRNNFITVYDQCNYLLKDSVPNYYINPINSSNFQIFQEDFDSLIPYYSGHSTKWNVFKQAISPSDTNFFYGAASIFTTSGKANNWLEFGPLSIPASGATLRWKHLYYLNNKRDGYEVLLSTTGLTRDNYISPPVFSRLDNDPLTDGNTSWTSQQVLIPSGIYGNSDIYVAFHHFADNMYYLFLDDIELVSCYGLPVFPDFNADTTIILDGGEVDFTDLSSGNPISWEWTFYGGIPGVSYEQNPKSIKYSNVGIYSVKLKIFNGESTDSVIKYNYINVIPSGLNDDINPKNLNIFPNPALNYTMIDLIALNKDVKIQLLDMSGRSLYETLALAGTNRLSIPLSCYKSGCYLLKVINISDQIVEFRKLIIMK